MTNRGRFNKFLQSELDRLLAMSDYRLSEAATPRSNDDTAYELFQIFLRKQRYDLFVMPKGKLAVWLGSQEEMMAVESMNFAAEENGKETS